MMMMTLFLLVLSQLSISLAEDPAYKGLSWFVHITDIHISHLEAPDRTKQLEQFVQDSLAVLQPDLVLCGGDLTDAKKPGHFTSDQNKHEWETYRKITAKRWNDIPWLDIRGNHDNLNVLGRSSDNNMFANYSVQGPFGHLHSYTFPWQSRGQKFNFVAVDATWEMGMTFPFNFEGYLDEDERQILEAIRRNLTRPDEVTIIFGHYPTSVVYQSEYLRELSNSGLVYMSGHLHDLMMFHVHNMYSFHGDKEGLELELVDWKINRAFRLFAVDRGVFSFVDLRFDTWPVILPTFPKDSRFWMPSKEPMDSLQKEDSVRVLAFSDVPIVSVTVKINDEDAKEASAISGGPLYSMPWNSSLYSRGLHRLQVTARDTRGRNLTHSHTFTFNPEEVISVNNWFPNLVLRSSFVTVFHVIFALTFLGNLGGMLFFRWRCTQGIGQTMRSSSCSLLRKLLIVCRHDRLFYPLLAFVLYMVIGPWTVGEVIEGRIGAVFAWGVIVEGAKTHSQATFIYYFIHFAVIHPAMVMVLGHVADWRCGHVTGSQLTTSLGHVVTTFLFLATVAIGVFFSITFWLQYGIMGFFLGPLKTWSYVFYSVMLVVASTLPENTCIGFVALINIRNDEKKTDGDEEEIVQPFRV